MQDVVHLTGAQVAADFYLSVKVRKNEGLLVGLKGVVNQALLYACIEPNLADRGFFLRKAIGWALREYGKAAPDEVRRYVAENEQRLSGLSRREALKHVGRLQSEAASA